MYRTVECLRDQPSDDMVERDLLLGKDKGESIVLYNSKVKHRTRITTRLLRGWSSLAGSSHWQGLRLITRINRYSYQNYN